MLSYDGDKEIVSEDGEGNVPSSYEGGGVIWWFDGWYVLLGEELEPWPWSNSVSTSADEAVVIPSGSVSIPSWSNKAGSDDDDWSDDAVSYSRLAEVCWKSMDGLIASW